jgi:hypothetical protein
MSSYVLATGDYVFSPSTNSISFALQPGFSPSFVKAITNQTQNQFIYLPGITGFGGTWDSTGIALTFQADVSAHDAGDLLLIQYDDQSDALNDIVSLLAGTNSDPDKSIGGFGAQVKSPTIEDLLRRLIVEVRISNVLYMQSSGTDADLDGMVVGISQSMIL